ncbi:cupin domain-containing protein [Streptomyces sp. NPDC014983]|uniref:cupin domain-containing protein n=1 Tax=Streptomyces sp. NPDC014983 TaxID=3364933 RepID=UPI0036FAECC6
MTSPATRPTAGHPAHGAVLKAQDLLFRPVGPCQVAEAVGPHLGAETIRLDVARIPAGATWQPPHTAAEENVAVVFAGHGHGRSGTRHAPLARGGALYAPTGDPCALTASDDGELVAYLWSSRLLPGRRHGTAPRRFSSLDNDETQLTGFTGTGHSAASERTATMNFVFWPGTGTPQLCLHCGMMRPGEYFNVHVHPHSEEAFIAFEGSGQLYLHDHWIDAAAGDILFARPGVPHGTRLPDTHPADRFVTCGGPTPFDPVLYARARVSGEVR